MRTFLSVVLVLLGARMSFGTSCYRAGDVACSTYHPAWCASIDPNKAFTACGEHGFPPDQACTSDSDCPGFSCDTLGSHRCWDGQYTYQHYFRVDQCDSGSVAVNVDPPRQCDCFAPPRADDKYNWAAFADVDSDGCFEPSLGDVPIAYGGKMRSGATTQYPRYGVMSSLDAKCNEWNGGKTDGLLDGCLHCRGRRCSGNGLPCMALGASSPDCADASTCEEDCCEKNYCDPNASPPAALACGTGSTCLTVDTKVCSNSTSTICLTDADCTSPGTCTVTGGYCLQDTSRGCTQNSQCSAACLTDASSPTGKRCDTTGDPCIVVGDCKKCTYNAGTRYGHCSCTGSDWVYRKCIDVQRNRDAYVGQPGLEGLASSVQIVSPTFGDQNCLVTLETNTGYGLTTPALADGSNQTFLPNTDVVLQTDGVFRSYAYNGWKEHDWGTSFRAKASSMVLGHDECPAREASAVNKQEKTFVSIAWGQDTGTADTDSVGQERIMLWASTGCIIGGQYAALAQNEIRVTQNSDGHEKVVLQAPLAIDFGANWNLEAGGQGGEDTSMLVEKSAVINTANANEFACPDTIPTGGGGPGVPGICHSSWSSLYCIKDWTVEPDSLADTCTSDANCNPGYHCLPNMATGCTCECCDDDSCGGLSTSCKP